MKVLGIIKKIIMWILAIIFFGFAIAMTVLLLNFNIYGVSQFGDTSLILIREKMSSNNYKKGDLVLVEATKLADIKVGDEMFAYQVDKDGKVTINVGTVDKVSATDDAVAFKNGNTYATKFIAGKTTKIYHNIGTYLSVIESKWGFLFMILVPSFLIFVYEVYALIVEIKYGKDEQ